MEIADIMRQKIDYVCKHTDTPSELQVEAKELCWQYNQTRPSEMEKRIEI